MQRNNGGTRGYSYVQRNVESKYLPNKKQRRRGPRLGLVLLLVGTLLFLIFLVFGISQLFTDDMQSARINAMPTDQILPFGEEVIYYDGMSLHCARANGSIRWSYSLGTNGSFSCSNSSVVAWIDNQLYVINKDGKATYSDRMEGPIRFARVGENYVAACIGEELNSSVRVCTLTGAIMVSESFPDLYLLDIGFFYNNDQLMWVLGLDLYGNAPVMSLSTYEPGKLSTGAVELQDELVYEIYTHNNMLMVVDTTKIRTFNYKCVEQSDIDPVLVYGWQMKQSKTIGRNTYALFEKMPTIGDATTFSELRLVTNQSIKSLRLLSPCIASGLGEKGVYGFGSNVIYYAPYGASTFSTNALQYPITDFVCMLEGNRAVIVSGDSVYIIKLPT